MKFHYTIKHYTLHIIQAVLFWLFFALNPAYAASKDDPPVARWRFDEGGRLAVRIDERRVNEF